MAEFLDYTPNPVDWNKIPLANAQLQATQNANALFPLQQEAYQQRNALGALDVEAAKQNMAGDLIRQTANTIDWDDPNASQKWDQSMQDLVEKGHPEAKQWIGKGSQANTEKINTIYGGNMAPGRAGVTRNQLPAPTGPGIGGPVGAPLGPTQQYDFNNLSQDQVQQHLDKSNKIVSELTRVMRSPAPALEWARVQAEDPEAQRMGPYSSQMIQGMYQQQLQMQQMYQQRYGQQIAGVPTERNVPTIDKSPGGGLTAVDQNAPGGPTAKRILEPERSDDWFPTGDFDKDGKPILTNRATGETKVGSVSAVGGRYLTGAGGKLGNTQAERFAQRFIDIHKNDPEYANNPAKLEEDAINWGRGFNKPPKDMSDAEIAIAAARAALGDPKLEKQYADEFRAARAQDRANTAARKPQPQFNAPFAGPDTRGIAGRSATPPPSSMLKEGQITRFKNGQAWALRNGQPVQVQ